MRGRLNRILTLTGDNSYSHQARMDQIKTEIQAVLNELDDAEPNEKDSPEEQRRRESRQAEDAKNANPPGSPHNLIEQALPKNEPEGHVRAAGDQDAQRKIGDAIEDSGSTNADKEKSTHKTAANGEKIDNPPAKSDTLVSGTKDHDGAKAGDKVRDKGKEGSGDASKHAVHKDTASNNRR